MHHWPEENGHLSSDNEVLGQLAGIHEAEEL